MNKRIILSILLVIALAGSVPFGPKIVSRIANAVTVPGMAQANAKGELSLGAFPDIQMDGLSPVRRRIVELAKNEHTEQPGYTKYTEGYNEAWCASFASWIMKKAGVPYDNPHSGNWRIPGTLTLREYYESEKRFRTIDSGYEPKLGDVVLYDGAGWFGQHTNIVLKNENGMLTTIGGNEAGKIRIQTKVKGIEGTVGYGLLNEEKK